MSGFCCGDKPPSVWLPASHSFIDSPLFAVIEFLYLPCSSVYKCLSETGKERQTRDFHSSSPLSRRGCCATLIKIDASATEAVKLRIAYPGIKPCTTHMSAGDCRKKLIFLIFHWMGKEKGIICNIPALTHLFWVARVKARLKGNFLFILLYRTVEKLQYMSPFWNVCMFKIHIHL